MLMLPGRGVAPGRSCSEECAAISLDTSRSVSLPSARGYDCKLQLQIQLQMPAHSQNLACAAEYHISLLSRKQNISGADHNEMEWSGGTQKARLSSLLRCKLENDWRAH